MGTPGFAVPSLRELAGSHDVALVLTRPDAASSRGSQTRPSAVKEFALSAGLPVAEVETLRDAEAAGRVIDARPEVICVAAFGLLLPREVLAVPPSGCVNVHASILPKHRGAAPIQRALLEGDEVTGVSIMRMEEGLDTGPVAAVGEIPVDRHDTVSLSAALGELGASLLIGVLERLAVGEVRWDPQDDAGATYADKIARSDVQLDPEVDALTADRRVRASSSSVPAAVLIAGRRVVVTQAEQSEVAVDPGAVRLHDDGPLLGFRDGSLALLRVTPAGRRPMSGEDFARGLREPVSTWEAV